MPRIRAWLVLAVLFAWSLPAGAQKEFGFDNRKPSGQPYLSPEETVARMKVADGFEVKLFAAEPMLVNPIAFTLDEKGRVWAVECFEYPKRTPPGKMPRDRIVILEDTDGDGKADKRTVFAEGKDFPTRFDMASGIEVGHGGVFLGAPPYLWFLKDTDGDGKCDHFEILLKGFGSHDTHETLNTFQWGPDGRLYGLHGVFTNSEVHSGEPGASAPGVKMNAAVWRYDVRAKKFEIFAEGTSNPWGMDWRNTDGQFILCCCVIPHLYHIIPGGVYRRQAGNSFNPYAYGEIKEICDHTFHRESGWAHAGLLALDSPHIPKEYQDSVIFGSIHGCSIKRNVLKPNGSTFTASRADDFLVSGDKNFRPINLRWGPQGDIYVSDWHDQNPCHQTPPDNWDYEHGRIYRIQPKGLQTKKTEDLGRKTNRELVTLLQDVNPYRGRTALRLIGERTEETPGRIGLPPIDSVGWKAWRLQSVANEPAAAGQFVSDWAGKAAAERSPVIRRELASLAQRLGKTRDTIPLLHALMRHPEDANDPVIPLLIWLAYEPQVVAHRDAELGWHKDHAAGNPLVTDHIVPRTVRRLVATGKGDDLNAAVAFLGDVRDAAVRRRALEGLTQALDKRQVDPPAAWRQVRAELYRAADPEVRRLAKRLGVSFRDDQIVRTALAEVRNGNLSPAQRLEHLRDLAVAQPPEAREVFLDILLKERDAELRREACRGLAAFAHPEIPAAVLRAWKEYPPEVRAEVANLLAGRKEWGRRLLEAVAQKQVPAGDLTRQIILRLAAFKDRTIDDLIAAHWGKVRETPEDLVKLIDQMRAELDKGEASFARGRKVFEAQCAKCHKFEGQGSDVGPELDGAARDIEYLLGNVLDPNRVIGQPYLERFVARKDGRVERGLLAAEDDQTLTLKQENAVLKVIPKKEIEEVTVQDKSIMPEGLGKAMTVQDFRDLIRYVMVHPFPEEVRVAVGGGVDPAAPAANGGRWQRVAVPVTGRIPLPGGKEAPTWVAAKVTAAAATKTRLLLGAGQPVRAWVNGKEVYQGKPGAGAAPDQAGVEVTLRAGDNDLLFQVTPPTDGAAFYVRLLDPQRQLSR